MRKGWDKSTGPKSSPKYMFKRHSERNCQKRHTTPARGTYTCLKACIIVDLHYTLNYADCSKQIWKSASYSFLKIGTSFGGAINSRNSRATAQKLNQTRIMCLTAEGLPFLGVQDSVEKGSFVKQS